MMKVIRYSLLAVTLLAGSGVPLSAQSSGVERAVDAIESVVDRMMVRVSNAFNRGEGETIAWTQAAESFEWTGSIPSGESLEIKGINGSITVGPATGSEVVVTAEATGRRSDPSTVRIEMVEHGDGLTFCAVYPNAEGERENYCGAGSQGRMSTNRNDVEVHFYVEVPAGVEFIGQTVNGEIEALDLDSDLTVNTVNGDIELSTSGFAEAETVNGSIDAVMGSRELRHGATFSTVNGSITLDLNDDVDADLDASWLNGAFETDLPFALEGRMSRRSARGTLGSGGPDLELSTVNGSIRIR
jgi:hypothetical protein